MIFWSFRPFRCCLGWSIHSIVALTYCPQHSVLQCHVSGKTTPRTDVAEPPLPPPPETVQKLVYCVGVSMVWLVLDGLGLCSMSKWKIMTSIAFNQSHWIPVNVDAFWMLLNVLKGLLQRHSLIMFSSISLVQHISFLRILLPEVHEISRKLWKVESPVPWQTQQRTGVGNRMK